MDADHLTIGFVRRGYSRSGGAESYLQRLAGGVREAGHQTRLVTTDAWPDGEWQSGLVTRVSGKTPTQFADEFEALRPTLGCDVIMSLERVWQCDVYRAGDGVHRAWLARRARYNSVLGKMRCIFNRKHRGILRLEESLFGHAGARRVIVNSQMVQREIEQLYGCPEEQIDVVRNGLPLAQFRFTPEARTEKRQALGLAPESIAALFVGSGWERKGLRFAITAVENCNDPRLQLLVAGHGTPAKYRSRSLRFLGVVQDLQALYAAADIFLLPTIYDPSSNACLEAMAVGLPVITTKGNGFSELMEEGRDGSIIKEPDNTAALCAALRFWSNGETREKSRASREEHAREFSIGRNVSATLQILLQATASAASTSGKIRKT